MPHSRRTVIIGYGVVAQALLPMLVKHLRVPAGNLTIIDFADRAAALRPWIDKGVNFVRERITPLSLPRLLSAHARAGDLIIDLAWSVEFFDISQWAHEHDVIYVNASLESWDPEGEAHRKPTLEKTLYARYSKLLPMVPARRNGATAVIDHGSNPGLVSHFVKAGLLDLGQAVLKEKTFPAPRRRKLERHLENEDFAQLAQELDVKVIHCSERDTQRSNVPKSPDEFVSTWSVEGMWEESIAPCEIGWGTHEKWLPPFACVPDFGPRNQIALPQMGMNSWIRSWVPNEEIVGMIVAHGEAFGLSHALTVKSGSRVVYRPTVQYAYMPCGDSIVSLHELRARNYELHPRRRIMTNEIVTGTDTVGALIMGHPLRAWWTGSMLSIDEARKKVSGVNATAVQVAAGVLAAVVWAVRNPRRGICLPEDLPHRDVLSVAMPYLGQWVSTRSDWTPLSQHRVHFEERTDTAPDLSDPWQFRNFLLHR